MFLTLTIGFFQLKFEVDYNQIKTKLDQQEQWFQAGRRLFYDTILSHNKKISCSTCHQQQYAFAYSYDKRHTKIFDKVIKPHLTPSRDILPLFNLSNYSRFMWDGRANGLNQQLSLPIHNIRELNSNWQEIESRVNNDYNYINIFSKLNINKHIDSTAIIKAITTFEMGLISNHSKYDRVNMGLDSFNNEEKAGFNIMNNTKKGNCFSCHNIELRKNSIDFANNGFLNVENLTSTNLGLYSTSKKTKDRYKFKVPTLRNLSYTAPYMHDASIAWLDFVINFYSKQIADTINLDNKMNHYKPNGIGFTEVEKRQILAFLATLNDTSFVNNSRYSNPFR